MCFFEHNDQRQYLSPRLKGILMCITILLFILHSRTLFRSMIGGQRKCSNEIWIVRIRFHRINVSHLNVLIFTKLVFTFNFFTQKDIISLFSCLAWLRYWSISWQLFPTGENQSSQRKTLELKNSSHIELCTQSQANLSWSL